MLSYSAVPCRACAVVASGGAGHGWKKIITETAAGCMYIVSPPAAGPPCLSEQPPARYRRLFARRLRLFPPPSPKKCRPCCILVRTRPQHQPFSPRPVSCSGRRPRCITSSASHLPLLHLAAASRKALPPPGAAKLNIASLPAAPLHPLIALITPASSLLPGPSLG